ncbi:hypothetical protein [Kitasatospora sp. NPDC001225]
MRRSSPPHRQTAVRHLAVAAAVLLAGCGPCHPGNDSHGPGWSRWSRLGRGHRTADGWSSPKNPCARMAG